MPGKMSLPSAMPLSNMRSDSACSSRWNSGDRSLTGSVSTPRTMNSRTWASESSVSGADSSVELDRAAMPERSW